ncbi:DUF3472 domain-containing protein [Actinoplanes sp. LDG1-06]|uniref:DUF3472 domain-containing protein n=1 Tax=Paractinoplanes ovalisporus TaxID=2810368 RepID=A0ABS2AKA0_9ACTN|nr:DUF3472 domain-containing protein [Actinoplanes ovalisporus]MBM2620278.1 DUF3472 domain-containing protein [Actinoplanes ovalisporus]
MKRAVMRVVVVLVAAVVGFIGLQVPADAAAQHQNANLYAYWNFHGRSGFWNVDQQVRVSQKARASYWAMNFGFTTTPDEGGYLGLQTDGQRFNGTKGDTAIFSLWNANATRGSNCGRFSGEGTGRSCRIPYAISTGTYYRLRVWRLAADSGGQWWGAWVANPATGKDTPIGQIRVPRGKTLLTPPMNFSEYFGPARTCDTVPASAAYFTQPAANSRGGGSYQYGSVFASSHRGSCTGGSVRVINVGSTKAALVRMGGHR